MHQMRIMEQPSIHCNSGLGCLSLLLICVWSIGAGNMYRLCTGNSVTPLEDPCMLCRQGLQSCYPLLVSHFSTSEHNALTTALNSH